MPWWDAWLGLFVSGHGAFKLVEMTHFQTVNWPLVWDPYLMIFTVLCLLSTWTRTVFVFVTELKKVFVFILVINQIVAQNFFYNKFISCLYMFRAHVFIIRRSKLYYTVSGIITPVGGRPVHGTATYRCDDTRGCVIQFWPPDDEHMCSKHVEAWNKLIVKQNFVH